MILQEIRKFKQAIEWEWPQISAEDIFSKNPEKSLHGQIRTNTQHISKKPFVVLQNMETLFMAGHKDPARDCMVKPWPP